jgi:hypothetical protein
MGYRNLGSKAHSVIHFTCISGIAVGLPLNKVVLSLSLMLGVLNLFIEADFRAWIKKILGNRFFLMIAGFWLLHVLGLLWSSELDFGLRDIRVKLPLLVIPFLLTIKPLKKGEVKTVVVLFLVSTLITSLLNFVFYQGWIGSIVYDDIRGMSLFGSHSVIPFYFWGRSTEMVVVALLDLVPLLHMVQPGDFRILGTDRGSISTYSALPL